MWFSLRVRFKDEPFESFKKVPNFPQGYKEYDTKRRYLVTLGDWRNNKDEEVELDGVGGVNILVKADVHRSGKLSEDDRL